MKSLITRGIATGFAAAALCGALNAEADAPKYVFFFLGDGMSSVQIQAAEAYKTHLNGGDPDDPEDLMSETNRLNMSQFPIMGMATTYCDEQFITDSAAAATAFCCGIKTTSGTIGRNSDMDTSYKSFIELAKEQKGKKIGVISSVSLPHATPAAAYARVNSRNNYAEIGYQAAQSDVDFFGGGCFRKLTSDDNAGGITVSNALASAGYVTVNSIDEAIALDKDQKVICSVATSFGSDAMPYAMDRDLTDNFSLAEVTEAAIERLQSNNKGFVIYVEGGKIDWAGHANDSKANIMDTLAFDDAVGVALDFYKEHKKNTLIVVTGDHETGGMTLGYAGTKYKTAFDKLDDQPYSYEVMTSEMYAYKTSNTNYVDADSNIDEDMITLIEENTGMIWSDDASTTNGPSNYLSDYQKELLEEAYDRYMGGSDGDQTITGYDLDSFTTVDYETYGGYYNPIVMTLTHIMNKEAGLGWTSYSHTAVPVPVMAIGKKSAFFAGSYDNTDIAVKMGKALKLKETLPVEDTDYAGSLDY